MADTRLPYCSPYRLLAVLAPAPATPGAAIHHAYAQFAWRSMGIQHVLLVALLALLWPAIFVTMACMFTRKIGPSVARTTGKGLLRQLAEQIWLAFAYSIPPDKYYVFELFRDERRAQASDYILRYELKGGLHNLMHFHAKEQAGGNSSKGALKDKLQFSRICRAGGVDAPIILVSLDQHGAVTPESHDQPSLPRDNIFIKPARGKGGRGCEKWIFDGSCYRGPGGQILSEGELIQHIAGLAARRGRYLVQECLENHQELRELGDGITSVRITSCRNESDSFEVTNATLKMSLQAGGSVDNFHQGGAVAKVDIINGVVGPASDSWHKKPCTWHDVHPLTRAPIRGRTLPRWRETIAMVEKAHALFPDRIMLGFDVAITDRGPVVIEGNVQSGCDMVQRTHDLPVGQQRLGQILAFHARRASATRPPKHMRWFGPLQYWRRR
ncbi:putative polysaccharide biosynthesis protein [Dongia mobilis]|uniref:Putative polysaccharide biosynthesis protein n=1 Tax=Dongia mobilis TaxID=578943 RepID=A0A4R6WRG8_9PROT|nr:sugar-transfer associated ATP-grasp domain-containing protein [Dongia mobilis]TDQ81387.1 putative polysaccharide biosynthesis protein [Dongia mobilis]